MAQRQRARPQQARAVEMRQRLLDSALSLLETHGAVGLTTTALAKEALVSTGTVYRYFNDRDQILGLLRDAAVQEISTGLATAVGRTLDLPLLEAMTEIIDSLTAAFERHAAVFRATLESEPVGVDSGLLVSVEASLFPLARVLPARHRPDLSETELDDLVFVTMGMTATTSLRIALFRPPGSDRRRMVEVAARMLEGALTAP